MVTTTWIAVLLASTLSALSAAAETSVGQRAEPDESAQVRGNSEFAFDLYAALRSRHGNVFVSPYSISTALGMTHAGARGPTATEMATVLRFPVAGDRLHEAFSRVTRDVNRIGSGRKAELYVANALWPQTGLRLNPAFEKTMGGLYGAGLDAPRFPECAREGQDDDQ